jgi:hypothetical protein
MPEGTVTARRVSPKGAAVIVIDGADYYAGRTDVSDIRVGDRISFDSAEFAPGRYGLNGWKRLAGVQNTATQNYVPGQQVSGLPMVQTGWSESERLTISNWVAHAIGAGVIKEPEQIEKWVSAARTAIREQSK